MDARLLLAVVACAAVLPGCVAPAAAPSPTPAPATATAGTPTPSAEAGAIVFQVQPGSKAVVRVREQLASVPAPSDAVLESADVKGSFGLRPDGTFTPSSKITVGLAALRSDSGTRDNFVKGQTLQVSRFPTADFVPQRTTGLPTPLPAAGEWTVQVAGRMTIRGTEKDVAFDVRVKRAASSVTASAKNATAWTFGDFGLEVPRVASVLSIVDEIRLEVEVVATEGS